MRGILALTKRHSAKIIEEAARIALDRRVRSSGTVKRLVENLEKEANAANEEKQLLLPELTQSHDLIRDPLDYAKFFAEHSQVTVVEIQKQPNQEACHVHVDR